MGGRLDHIHGLRGIAALAVVFQHAAILVQEAGHSHFRLLLEAINPGRFGVVLFFLISGVVIPFSFKGTSPLRDFLIARVFRLFPVYWLSIPLLAFVGMVARGADYSALQILLNTTMLQWFFGVLDVGFGYWTLRFEVVFYVLSALLFWRNQLGSASVNGISVAACLFIAVSPVISDFVTGASGYSTLTFFYLAVFFLGMLLRHAMVDDCPVARTWSVALVPLTIAVAVLVSGVVVPVDENVYFPPVPLAASLALPIVVLVAVLWLKPSPPAWMMWLGSISYSLYLFQDISLLFLPYVVSPADWPIIYVVAVIGATATIASITYRYVEKPMIELGRRLKTQGRPIAEMAAS